MIFFWSKFTASIFWKLLPSLVALRTFMKTFLYDQAMLKEDFSENILIAAFQSVQNCLISLFSINLFWGHGDSLTLDF